MLIAVPSAAPAQNAAQVDTVDTSLPTQLPRTAVPHHYALTVTPHAEKLSFDATVAIDLEIVKPTQTLVLNAVDMTFSSATIAPGAGTAPLTGQAVANNAAETVTVTFPRTLTPGAYRLELTYSGRINTQANGLFALDYKTKEGADGRSLFTQFEAADARRFVPSWDEPDYKAKWDLTARVPESEMAVSNVPTVSSRPLGNGLKEVRFGTTPTMSSYLLFFATGDFERVTKMSAGREVGIVVSRGNGPKAMTASTTRRRSSPTTTNISALPTRCRNSTMSLGPVSRCSSPRWRIGARSSHSSADSSTIRRSRAPPTAMRFSAPKRTRWRTSGLATW